MPRKRKRKRTRITPEIIERMVELRKRGSIYGEISKELGIALQTVAKHMQTKKTGGQKEEGNRRSPRGDEKPRGGGVV